MIRDFLRQCRQSIRALNVGAEYLRSNEPFSLLGMRDFRRENFPACGPFTWLDQPNALELIEERVAKKTLTSEDAEKCRFWVQNGYWVAEGLFSPQEMNRVWEAYEVAEAEGRLDKANPGLDAHMKLSALQNLIRDRRLMDLCDLFLGVGSTPFQSITRKWGSQQAAHSDAIHMTTHPLGYLAAAWVALEDIHPDSGPLFYYPGSHKLPYVMSQDVHITAAEHRANPYKAYHERYEPHIQRLVEERGFERKLFTPKSGSVLFWHHNLVHGGSPINNPLLTRKDVVFHYFSENVVCYHDLSGSLAEHRR